MHVILLWKYSLLKGLCCVVLQFTNMGQGFQGTLDYVLYTTNSLVPTATLELPDEADIKSSRSTRAGLPNETWSSDHIALLAEFQYKQH